MMEHVISLSTQIWDAMIHATRTLPAMHLSTHLKMLRELVRKQHTIHRLIRVTTIELKVSALEIGEFESITCHIPVAFPLIFGYISGGIIGV